VILVAAGAGVRFGGPKAFVDLGGEPLVARAAAAFAPFPEIEERICVLRAEDLDRAPAGWRTAAGGARRRDSVAAGQLAMAPDTTHVLVHDAARAMVPRDVVARVLEAARRLDAVIPVVPVADTIKRVEGGLVRGTLDRAGLHAVQTPQAFAVPLLRRALAEDDRDATDEAALVEALGEPVATVPGDPRNLKITSPEDLRLAGALLASRLV
jgi:2-C-methyl-D-erythritol 4-phosphate cytidylyltransferase